MAPLRLPYMQVMIDEAHSLGVQVKPWTVSIVVGPLYQIPHLVKVNRNNIIEQLLAWKADGIITDCGLSVQPFLWLSDVLEQTPTPSDV